MIGGEVEVVRVINEDWIASQRRYICFLLLLFEGNSNPIHEVLGELCFVNGD